MILIRSIWKKLKEDGYYETAQLNTIEIEKTLFLNELITRYGLRVSVALAARMTVEVITPRNRATWTPGYPILVTAI